MTPFTFLPMMSKRVVPQYSSSLPAGFSSPSAAALAGILAEIPTWKP
jgi:hypothetical protein